MAKSLAQIAARVKPVTRKDRPLTSRAARASAKRKATRELPDGCGCVDTHDTKCEAAKAVGETKPQRDPLRGVGVDVQPEQPPVRPPQVAIGVPEPLMIVDGVQVLPRVVGVVGPVTKVDVG
jgi:hypothetical protein